MTAATKPNIIANPRGDRAFAELAERHASDGADTPHELQHRLREHYPRARVVSGIYEHGGGQRWYAYREGHWLDG